MDMNMKRIDWKNVLARAAKTFVQAFVASLSMEQLVAAADAGGPGAVLRPMLVAGFSAGISAVWNMVQEYFLAKEAG